MLDKHAPVSKKTVLLRPSNAWFNEDVQEAKRKRRRAERKWRKSPLTINKNILEDACEDVRKACSRAKSAFFCKKLSDCNGDQKLIYKIGNDLLHRKPAPLLPSFKSPSELAQRFCDFFSEKIKKIRDTFPSDSLPDVSHEFPNLLTDFKMLLN